MNMLLSLENRIRHARGSLAYKNYLHVRSIVLRMTEEATGRNDAPSDYWQEELAGFEYMFDASPLIIEKLREHCYHITGLLSYSYRKHHTHQAKRVREKLKALKAVDTIGLCVPESQSLGGFGFEIDGGLYNIDTLKFYESLIALNLAGVLDYIRSSQKKRSLVVEIGSGWGGFAYQLKTICPNTTYVCVDLPQSLMLAAVYLMTVFPESKSEIYGNVPNDQLFVRWEETDFIFLPHYAFKEIKTPPIDVGVNMVSFQEMTDSQVDYYARALAEKGCKMIYSHNRHRSPHNPQLGQVTDALSNYYKLKEIDILDVPYTKLDVSTRKDMKPLIFLREVFKKIFPVMSAKNEPERNIYEYRHFIGKLRK